MESSNSFLQALFENSFFVGGIVFGVATGFLVIYFINKSRKKEDDAENRD